VQQSRPPGDIVFLAVRHSLVSPHGESRNYTFPYIYGTLSSRSHTCSYGCATLSSRSHTCSYGCVTLSSRSHTCSYGCVTLSSRSYVFHSYGTFSSRRHTRYAWLHEVFRQTKVHRLRSKFDVLGNRTSFQISGYPLLS